MAKGSFFKKLAASAAAAALFLCQASAVWAESEYSNNDKLYSRNGENSIYISEDQFLYNFKGQTPGVTICGYVGDSTELNIPGLINGREVSAIEEGTFEGDSRIESVSFSLNIKSIGKNCFNNCPNLKNVRLSNGVYELDSVFCDCPKLESIYLPSGVGNVLDSFKGCTSLSYVKFARSVTRIDNDSFRGCTALTQLDWAGGLVKLGNAFDECTALESVSIPNGVIQIDGAFDGCTALREVSFPDSLLYITSGFSDCTALTQVVLPNSLLFVNSAFVNCKNLSKLKSSETTKISDTAFIGCPKIVIEKDANDLLNLFGWLILAAVMVIVGLITYRFLTSVAKNDTRKNRQLQKA